MNFASSPTSTSLILLFFFPLILSAQELTTHFEMNPNETVTYEEGLEYWEKLSTVFPQVVIDSVGTTDIGKPLHLVMLSEEGLQSVDQFADSSKPLLFINNAIHPGEPCGVDATMLFARDILQDDKKKKWLEEVNIVAIPFYNVGGVLNRNSTTRTNQNGPKEYGFRGNAKNLDLNRDFIKADSKNAQSFNQLFAALQPDIFVDNHTTNGADYQYAMTLISSLPQHYQQPLRDTFTEHLIPYLYMNMARKYEMAPYVNSIGMTPFDGIAHFNDLPRYSMGYASLHNALSFTPEAHMLKSYEERVYSTYELLNYITSWTHQWGKELLMAKERSEKVFQEYENDYVLEWQIDTTAFSTLQFKGFEAQQKESKISGKERLYYDQNKPVTKEIKFYDRYQPLVSVQKPKAYLIPQAYTGVIDRLKWNGVELTYLQKDEQKSVQAYKILDFETVQQPYENHYLHTSVNVEKFELMKQFYKGDVLVNVNQPAAKYILETLEPQGKDSFFAWNFFDGVLQQKEYFSPYLFEDEAAELLSKHPEWKEELEQKKANDPEFAENSFAQLYFIYKKSDHYEPTHNIYPVYRIE